GRGGTRRATRTRATGRASFTAAAAAAAARLAGSGVARRRGRAGAAAAGPHAAATATARRSDGIVIPTGDIGEAAQRCQREEQGTTGRAFRHTHLSLQRG